MLGTFVSLVGDKMTLDTKSGRQVYDIDPRLVHPTPAKPAPLPGEIPLGFPITINDKEACLGDLVVGDTVELSGNPATAILVTRTVAKEVDLAAKKGFKAGNTGGWPASPPVQGHQD